MAGHSEFPSTLCPMTYLASLCPMTYLAFAWLIALTNQVIRLARHSEFTSALCPELKQRRETQTQR